MMLTRVTRMRTVHRQRRTHTAMNIRMGTVTATRMAMQGLLVPSRLTLKEETA